MPPGHFTTIESGSRIALFKTSFKKYVRIEMRAAITQWGIGQGREHGHSGYAETDDVTLSVTLSTRPLKTIGK